MKKMFFLFSIAGCTTVSAQQKELFDINSHLKKRNVEKNSIRPFVFPLKSRILLRSNTLLLSDIYSLPNGAKVFSSPMYKMPVICPDMNYLKVMPNVSLDNPFLSFERERSFAGKIPNGASPILIQQ